MDFEFKGKAHLLWINLLHLPNHLSDDVEQINALLAETQPKQPNNYHPQVETMMAPYFEQALLGAHALGINDWVELHWENEVRRMRKFDLQRIVDGVRRMAVKNQRHRNFVQILALTHLVAKFDATLEDVLALLLTDYPEVLIGAKATTLAPPALDKQVEKAVKSYGQSMTGQLRLFSDVTQQWLIPAIANDINLFAQIVEIREIRNSHVHRQGVKNKQYEERLQQFEDFLLESGIYREVKPVGMGVRRQYVADGQYMEITNDYIEHATGVCRRVLSILIHAICNAVIPEQELQWLEDDNARHFSQRHGPGAGETPAES